MKKSSPNRSPSLRLTQGSLLLLIPPLLALGVWLTPLAFVPVPWPDDSAFYFVAKHLFKWPPQWVMLPQAPFEPTYRIFNFNTMPFYPILLGLGRLIGIDGSFLLKIWPLSAWAISGSLLATVLWKNGLPWIGSLLIALLFGLDPELRWASVLVRPESLIGLFGMTLVLGLTFGFPKKLQPKKLWDPVSFLLALGAYCHFNAIHLVVPVLFCFAFQPKRLLQITARTTLYLSPWILTVLYHWNLFVTQMPLQWSRFVARNTWLDSPRQAIFSLFQSMGSPEPWPPSVFWPGALMWGIFFISVTFFLLLPTVQIIQGCIAKQKFDFKSLVRSSDRKSSAHDGNSSVLPALGWAVGATWLFDSKPEVWFMYYFHASLWCLTGVILTYLWKSSRVKPSFKKAYGVVFSAILLAVTAHFAWIDVSQALRLDEVSSWHWETYYDFVDCVDRQLTQLEADLKYPKPFKVWCPTFPDITVELSRKHPDWDLTRTNDFWSRSHLAIQQGWNAHAVVVTESIGWSDRTISGKMSEYPEVRSSWMLWKDYFLNQLWEAPGWKPNRYLCQRSRWQAFLFMNEPAKRP